MYCVLESVFRLCCVSSAVWICFLEAETRTIFTLSARHRLYVLIKNLIKWNMKKYKIKRYTIVFFNVKMNKYIWWQERDPQSSGSLVTPKNYIGIIIIYCAIFIQHFTIICCSLLCWACWPQAGPAGLLGLLACIWCFASCFAGRIE